MHSKLYEVASPQAGTWTLRVRGAGITNLFELAANEDLAPTLEAAVSTWQAKPGESVTITAALRDTAGTGIPGASVTAYMVTPTGTQQTLSLRDDGNAPDATAGDGIYSTATSGQTDGYYGLRIVATLADGGRRMTATDFAVGGGSARLAGNIVERGVDLDGDSLYDQLQADVDVQVLTPGKYLVTADLVDTQGATITTITGATADTAASGTARVTLDFDGRLIYQHGLNGPYTIANMTLAREDGTALGAMSGSFTTQAYSYQAFQHARLRLTGTGSDQGVDTNGDGLFDRLNVRLGLDADQGGTHLVTARLMTGDGREVDWTEGYVNLTAGSNELALIFDGQKVRRSGYTGSFVVTDLSVQGASGALVATEAYQTGSYAYTAFARIPTDLYVLPDDIQVNPDPATTGGRATITATIRNAGTAGGAFLAEFFLGNPEMGGTLIGTQTIARIPEEGAATTSMSWQAPIQPGSYVVYIRLNQGRALYEYDYSNNESWRSVAVTRQQTIDAQVQIDPQVLQLSAQGRVITSYIQLPTAYTPTAINVTTLRLNDSVTALPAPTEVVDHNRDGVPELMVKFDRQQAQALADALLPPFVYRGSVDLNVSGALNDGTQF
ncbi:MAG TPA: choice-of-anchor X domain-containing protein, partial [Herpetosiphonaceae bacterium]